MSDTLAGVVSLNLSLASSTGHCPAEFPTDGYGPKCVPPQRVQVKTGKTVYL